ncbi:MAG: ABC transporter ATP-binding protein [Phototrophicaceae bacterium]
MSEEIPVLEVKGITKRFPGVLANDHIDLKLYRGRVLGLLGENGAGKSTLMNMIYGLYQPDEGEILLNGLPVEIDGPNDAIAKGIGMVHQHFQLVDVLTVTENVMLGVESVKGLFLDRKSARQRIVEISNMYGLNVNPDAIVADLPVGIQQRVEIIKALYRQADILILDEPTAVLTPQEIDGLFRIIRTLLDDGVSIIFINHKLKEVLEICDDITVLRRGKLAGHAVPENSTEQSLASLMVGREVVLQIEKERGQQLERVMEIRNLTLMDERGVPVVKNVSLDIFAGEILGIAGVQGNGQTELIEAITGLHSIESGEVFLLDTNITKATPREITALGTGHVPEDRQRVGMVKPFEVMHNMVLGTYYQEPFSTGIVVNDDAIAENAEKLVHEYDVRPPHIHNTMSSLSGGNQQKVIIAREFSRPVKVLIAAQPTRGLDVGSIEFIHQQIIRMRDEGTAVILVSTELDEILSLSDRIAVMFAGEVIDTLAIEQADRDTVGLRMAGSMDSPQRSDA